MATEWRPYLRAVKGRWQAMARGVGDVRVYLGTHVSREEAMAAFVAFRDAGVKPAAGKRGPKPGQRTKARGRAWTERQSEAIPKGRWGRGARSAARQTRTAVRPEKPKVAPEPGPVRGPLAPDRVAMMRQILRRIG